MRNWITSPGFGVALVRLGRITSHCRTFLVGNSGNTHVTVGYSGFVVREFPSVGLRPRLRLRPMAYRDEIRLYFPKYYRITKRDNIREHPAFGTSSKPLLLVGELLARCTDRRIPRRTCNFTKVCFYMRFLDLKYLFLVSSQLMCD